MKLHFKKSLLLVLPLVLLSSCASSDEDAPTITTFETDKENYVLNSKVNFNIDVQDNITSSDDLVIAINITLPDGTNETISETNYRVTQEGSYKAVLTVTDESQNTANSNEISFNVIDLYSGWSNNESNYFNNLFGVDLPRTDLFNNNYDVYQIFDFNSQAAPGVRFEFSTYDENLLDEFISTIAYDDFVENTYEEVFQNYMTDGLTYLKAYEKNLDGNTYLMVMPYVYQNVLNINFQLFDHTIGNSWDTEFINTVISPDFQENILPLEITKNTENVVTYFTDYNWYFEGATMRGYLRGIIYNLDQSDITTYITSLIDYGYTEGTLNDFLTNGSVMLVYANEEAVGYALITISSALSAEIPFYYFEIMCG